jgi:hypothetical protein
VHLSRRNYGGFGNLEETMSDQVKPFVLWCKAEKWPPGLPQLVKDINQVTGTVVPLPTMLSHSTVHSC